MKYVAAFLLAVVGASGALAQSGASPFGAMPPQATNAIKAWEKLPPTVRASIEAQLAPLNEEQRRALLMTIPSLKNLSPTQLDFVLARVDATVPLPLLPPVLAAEYAPVPAAGKQFLAAFSTNPGTDVAQTFTATKSGTITRLETLIYNATGNVGSPTAGAPVTMTVYQGAGVSAANQIASGISGPVPYVGTATLTSSLWAVAPTVLGPARVVAGQQYTLQVVSATTVPYESYWIGTRFEDGYSGGAAISASLDAGADMGFRVYVNQ
jgi:hypothetical protein